MTEPFEERGGLPILPFSNLAALDDWLGGQPRDHKGIWVKLAKKDSGIASVSQRELVDAGLCFGWIDGLINRYDDRCYLIRFTPRRPKSKWSEINVERVATLTADKRMRAEGLRQVEAAKADGRWAAAYPPASRIQPSPDFQAALDGNADAAAFFATLKGANRYAILYRLYEVTDPERRGKAIAKWIALLARRETVYD